MVCSAVFFRVLPSFLHHYFSGVCECLAKFVQVSLYTVLRLTYLDQNVRGIWVFRLAQTSVPDNNVLRLEIGLIGF